MVVVTLVYRDLCLSGLVVLFAGVVEGAPRQGIHARHGCPDVIGCGKGLHTRAWRQRPGRGADVRSIQDFQDLGGGGELRQPCASRTYQLRSPFDDLHRSGQI